LIYWVADLLRLLVLFPLVWILVRAVRLGRRGVLPLAGMAIRASTRFGDRFGRLATGYPQRLKTALDSSAVVLGVALVLLGVAFIGLKAMGRELIPEVHQGRFTIEIAHSVGTPLDRNLALVEGMERRVLDHDLVAGVYGVAGAESTADARGDEGPHTARLMVELEPTTRLAAQEERVLSELREMFSEWDDVTANFRSPTLFSFRTPIEVVLFGRDTEQLQELSDMAMLALADVEGLKDLKTSLVPGFPEIRVRYDRVILERLGLSAGEVANSIRNRIQGVQATRISRGSRTDNLLVRLVEDDRSGYRELGRLNVNPAIQPAIPLDSVATIERATGPSEIRRVDQQKAVVLSANLVGFDLGRVAESIEQRMLELEWPEGSDFAVAGQSQEMQRSLSSLGFALALAVFLVYVIMASTFESLLHPLVILCALPLALVGIVGLLLALGWSLSVVVLIGFIVLAGVVVNNAIVLVDFINRLRADGLEREAAILQASGARLRPILITTATTVLGLLPLAFGFGEGAEIQQPLALTLIGGLASSTLLTLVVIPVIYRSLTGLLERSQ